eukprot:1029421-Prymnesium_polylepis.1
MKISARPSRLSAATGSSHQMSLCGPSDAVPFIGVRQCQVDTDAETSEGVRRLASVRRGGAVHISRQVKPMEQVSGAGGLTGHATRRVGGVG